MSKRAAGRKKRAARKKPVPKERIIFARNLQAARKAAGQTQGEMGRIAGLAQPFISELENGKTTVSLDNAAYLADAVGLPLYKLLMPYPQEESEAKPSGPGAGQGRAEHSRLLQARRRCTVAFTILVRRRLTRSARRAFNGAEARIVHSHHGSWAAPYRSRDSRPVAGEPSRPTFHAPYGDGGAYHVSHLYQPWRA